MTKILDFITATVPFTAPTEFKNFDKKLTDYLKYIRCYSAFQEQLELLEPYKDTFSIPTMLGMEVEVENIHKPLSLPAFWLSKPDHSLREGTEFYSVPLTPEQCMSATVALWIILKKLLPDHNPSFSWRCSDHVHLSILGMEEEEFRSLMFLSVLLEPVFFSLVGKDRENSNFCVPLTQAVVMPYLGKYLRKKIDFVALATSWPKYTAINLCRIFPFPFQPENGHSNSAPALGTIEFRQQGGTPKVQDALLWQAVILYTYKAAIGMPWKGLLERLDSLVALPKYKEFLGEVFPDHILKKIDLAGTNPKQAISILKMQFVKQPELDAPKLASGLGAMLNRYKSTAASLKTLRTFSLSDNF